MAPNQVKEKQNLRLFFAVELPADVRAALGRLRPSDDNRDYRWADAAQLHVTLAFLGEQPAERLDVLQAIGNAAAAASDGGVLRLGHPGFFGARRAPRVLWVDLAGDIDALLQLHGRLTAGLRQERFPVEDRPFRPHVTLARRRETARGGPPDGWPPAAVNAPSFALKQLTLFQSRLSPKGPTYVPVFEFPVRQLTPPRSSPIVPPTDQQR